MRTYNENYYAVIMAGGVGSRFWPVSTSKYPKQFHDFMGVGQTLIQLTYNRLTAVVPHQNILILTNEVYKDLVREQIPGINDEQIVPEPAMRNTAPCILLAALKIKKKNPDAVMLVAPSDHWIEDQNSFLGDIEFAFDTAFGNDYLLTLGIKPTFPNTGFGYIKYNNSGERLNKVERFTEKPTLRNARKYLEEQNYLWNAGIFIWKASAIIDSFKSHASELYQLFFNGMEYLNSSKEHRFVKETYPKAENISIDYAILEKSRDVYVISAAFNWDDLGTWGALYSRLPKDEKKNVVVNSRLVPSNSSGNIIYSQENKIVVVDGLKDYIIVEDKNVLLILPKNKEQEIKNLRNEAIAKYGENLE